MKSILHTVVELISQQKRQSDKVISLEQEELRKN